MERSAPYRAEVVSLASGLCIPGRITAQIEHSYGDASLLVLKDPRLCHHVATAGAAAGSGALSATAWTAIERGLAGDEAAARAGFDAVRTSLPDLDRLYAPILPAAAGKKLRTLQRLLAPLRALRRHARDALAG